MQPSDVFEYSLAKIKFQKVYLQKYSQIYVLLVHSNAM